MKKLKILIFLSAIIYHVTAENTIKIGQYEVLPNTNFVVQVEVENTDPFVAFQVDIPVPEGFKFIDGSASLNSSRISGHSLSASLLTGNILRLIAYSSENIPFVGNSGTFVSFSLKSGAVPSTYALLLNQSMLGNSQSTNILTGIINGSVTVLAPNIALSTNALNYGRVPLQTSAELSFEIYNTGSTNLTVNGLNFNDAQFTTTSPTSFSVSPNSTQSVSVRFSPKAKGTLNKQLQISSNDPDQPFQTIALEAIAFAVNELHTGSITGTSDSDSKLEFSVNNMESFTGIQFDINLPQPLNYIPGSARLFRHIDHTLSVNTINANTLRVVAFSSGNNTFSSNDGKLIELGFHLLGNGGYYPIEISNVIISDATGTNILSDTFNGYVQITSADIYTSSGLEFGDVSMTSQKTLSQTIYNWGQEPLIISQLTFSNQYFSSPQALPVIIQPYQQYDLPLVFKKNDKGAASGTMKIFSNDPDQSIYNVELTGNAFAPNYLKILPVKYFIGESKYLSIEVENIEEIVAVQFDLNFPENFTPDLDEILLTDRSDGHIVATTKLSGTDIRVIVYSNQSKSLKRSTGAVIKIPFNALSTLSEGSYNLIFSNGVLSNLKSENILYSNYDGTLNIKKPIFGDADGNEKIDAYDAALILRYSAGLDPLPTIDPLPWQEWRIKISDVDGNGKITAYDAALVLRRSVGLISSFPVEN